MAKTQESERAGEARRSLILDEALRLFASRGFRGTSIAAVADAAGISQPGVLHHFKTKEELLHAVLDERDRRAFEAAEIEREYSGGPVHRVLEVLGDIARWDLEHRDLVQLGHIGTHGAGEAPAVVAEWSRRRIAEYRGNLAAVVATGIEVGEVPSTVQPEALASLMLAAVIGCEHQWLLDESFDLVAAIEGCADMLRRDLNVAAAATPAL